MASEREVADSKAWWRDPTKLIPATGVAVGLLWSLGQVGLWTYYGFFGMTPSQAGWDPSVMLVRSALALALSTTVVAAGFGLIATVRRSGSAARQWPLVVGALVFLLGALVAISIGQAERARIKTAQGWTSGGFEAAIAFPGITTQCVGLSRPDSGDTAASGVADDTYGSPVMLIGEGSERLVVYDPVGERLALVPSSGVVIHVMPAAGCRLTEAEPQRSWRYQAVILATIGVSAVPGVVAIRRRPS